MTFNVKARVLLELGAELISSDGIALYELIKNSVDAGSERVDIRVRVALTASGHRVLQTRLAGMEPDVPLRRDFVEECARRYLDPTCDSETRDAFTNLFDGIKPSTAIRYAREFFKKYTYIEVEDWGGGMSIDDLNTKFLTIGTPNRVKDRAKLEGHDTLLGEKGIGRLSAMRLGQHMEVITSPSGAQRWASLTLDWSSLRDRPDLDLNDFRVSPEPGALKDSRADQGTLIRISDLQSDWTATRVKGLAQSEFSKLQDPFESSGELLELNVSFNEQDITAVDELDTDWLDKWHGKFHVNFYYEPIHPTDRDDQRRRPVLKGNAEFRVPTPGDESVFSDVIDSKDIAASGDGLYSLLAAPQYATPGGSAHDDPARYAGIDTLGPFEAEGYWFNRQRAQKEFGDNYEKFKAWLERWAGGLLMYRDGYRVYPYAAPDDDWLELDQRALRRKSFKLNRGQFVGYVRITYRENKELRDQTNRQGLCDSPEKRALIQCLQHVIWKELGALVTKHEEKATTKSLSTVREIEKQVVDRAKDAKAKLRELAKRVPEEKATVAELRGYVEELEAAWAAAKNAIKKQTGQAEVYLHLAGVGMLLEFVIHELNRITNATLVDLQSIKPGSLPPPLRSLSKQLQTLDKRLRILDPVSTPGRQRKEDLDITEVLETLIDAHEQQFERHNISATIESIPEGRPLMTNVVVGQMYQIFENLIANSVYWLTQHRSLHEGAEDVFTPAIEVVVNSKSRTIAFRDNGPGIEWADREKIFEPFFSKKPSGRGIGLYIVKSLCKENGIALNLLERNEEGAIPGFEFVMP